VRQFCVKGRQDRVKMGCRRRSTRFHGGVSTDRGGPSATVLVAVGALLPLVACLLLSTARDMVANTNLALVLVLVVVAAASFGSRATGLSAAVVSAVGFDVFLTQPYGQLRIHSAADVVTTVLLLLIGVAVTELALWGRRQQARASEQRGYLDGILQTTGSLAGAMSARKLIEQVEGQLVDLLDLDRAYYVTAFDRAAPVLQSDGTVTQRGRPLDVDRLGLLWRGLRAVARVAVTRRLAAARVGSNERHRSIGICRKLRRQAVTPEELGDSPWRQELCPQKEIGSLHFSQIRKVAR